MAIMTRCRWPPESWCGIAVELLARGAGRPTRSSSSAALSPRLGAAHAAMDFQHLGDLVAHREHRVQRCHRLLEDHADAVAAQPAQGFRIERPSTSAPSTTMRPPAISTGGVGSRRTVASAVRVLPQPDSPDEPEHLAGA